MKSYKTSDINIHRKIYMLKKNFKKNTNTHIKQNFKAKETINMNIICLKS